ncbi:hypothetical protein FGG08_003096 [Glutinoglossum americanum]|uniref:AB hydrolase-1 domain-containing protein n=1 Tax=Glutinoglossum americanum TaxID=1670608 RepID=A0A9P8I7X0_9PEZI|nr:hypothetical protein FGG08_003096 [Glutinoglossum americanum]
MPPDPPVARDSQEFTLSSGGILGYAEYGLDTAAPIFYFHGTPGSRLEGRLWAEHAAATGARIIAIDRPGIGLSSSDAGKRFLDWPQAVAELAQHLGLNQFSVLGMSGGAPFVLACAKSMPTTQIRSVGIVAGQGPASLGTGGMMIGKKIFVFVASWFPSFVDWVVPRVARDPNIFAQSIIEKMAENSEGDKACLEDDRLKTRLVAMLKESLRQGGEGLAHEGKQTMGSNWDFEIQDIHYEGIKMWYGDQDKICPAEMGGKIAERLKHAELKVFPGEGHASIAVNHGREILTELLSTW